jgi:hypothetical protein
LSTQGAEGIVLVLVFAGLLAGIVPGLWVGAAGKERNRGHPFLLALVGLGALAVTALYTVGGPPDQLFSRVVMLPLVLPIALVAVAVVMGIPMYATYLMAFRAASHLRRKV